MRVGTPEEAKSRAAATYSAAADSYDHPVNSFWDRYGRRTVDRLRLPQGARVLGAPEDYATAIRGNA